MNLNLPRRFVIILIGLASFDFSFGQTPSATPAPPICTIANHAWSAKGELVLGARIAAGGKSLELGRIGGGGFSGGDGKSNDRLEGFSMAGSELVDLFTGKVIRALPQLPRKPFLGTMEGIITLDPGDSLVFGVAFPRPPDPPPDKNGKPQDYQFELRPPVVAPVKFSIPFKPAG